MIMCKYKEPTKQEIETDELFLKKIEESYRPQQINIPIAEYEHLLSVESKYKKLKKKYKKLIKKLSKGEDISMIVIKEGYELPKRKDD